MKIDLANGDARICKSCGHSRLWHYEEFGGRTRCEHVHDTNRSDVCHCTGFEPEENPAEKKEHSVAVLNYLVIATQK